MGKATVFRTRRVELLDISIPSNKGTEPPVESESGRSSRTLGL